MADIAGHITTVTLDSTNITAQMNDVALAQAKNVMSKPTMDGTGDPLKLVGQKSGTLTVNGQVDDAGFAGLAATWAKDTAVPFEVVMGDGAALDAGKYSGNVTLSQFDKEAAASDVWNVTISGETDSVAYTPPV